MKKKSEMKPLQSERKGISLVVLVITILVMVIIAVAVIMGLANTNSIQKAKEANLKNEIANMLDKQSERYNELYIENDGGRDLIKDEDFGDIVPGDFEDRFEASKDGIIYNGEDEEEKKIAEEMGCIIPGKDDGGGSGGEGTDENISKYVSVTDLLLNSSTDTITIQTLVTGSRNNITFYHYQTRVKGQEEWEELKSPDSKVEIKNLKANTMYEVRVEVTDRENKKASSQVKEIATKDFGMPEITASTTEWTNQAVEVRIRYQNQEMINEFAYQEAGPWTPVKDTLLTLKVKENTKVYARSKDKAGNVKTSEIEIKNIDTLAPNKIQIVKTTGINSITVKASTSDKEATATSGMSGMKGYAFSKDNGRSFSEYNTTGEYVFDNLSFGESYLFQVKAIDNAGNETIEEIDTGTITYPAPTFSAVPSGWTNQNVSVTIHFQEMEGITKQYSRDAKNWITYTEPVIFEENGVLYARIIDNTGKISKVTSFVVTKIDKEAPIATVTPDGGSYTIPTDGSVAKIKAKISAQDLGGSGVREIKYAFSTNKTTAPNNWKVVQNNVEFTQEGLSKATYYLWVNITDNAGNQMLKVVTNNIYKITDKTDAINKIMLTSANTNYTNQDVNVIVKYGSNLVQNKKAGIQGGTLTANAGNVVVKENGTVYAEAEDMAGNKIYTTLAVGNIDKLPPTTTILPNGGNYTIPTAGNKAIIKARITASDTGVSGLNLVQYAWSTSNTTEPTSWINYTAGGQDISTTSGVGNMYLWTKVTDKAGSRAENIKVSNAYTVTANTAVENLITLIPNTTDWTNQDINVTVGYGANLTQNKKAEVEGVTIANPTIVTLTQNGVVYAEATDIGGNKITKTLQITNIDKVKPTSMISPNGGTYTVPTGGTVATLRAKVTSEDLGGSGLNLVQYAWSTSNITEPTNWTNYTASGQEVTTTANSGKRYLWTKIVDKAGNQSDYIKVSQAFSVSPNTAVENLITLMPNTTEWTNQNITVTVGYGSNISQNRKAGMQGGTLTTNATAVTVTANGVVYAEATDIGGNKITKTLQITNIDKTNPNTTSPSVTGTTNSLTATLRQTDSGGSGLNSSLTQYAIKKNGGSWGAWQTSNSFTGLAQGTLYQVKTRVKDIAGNGYIESLVTNYTTASVQSGEGKISVSLSPSGWTNGNVTVTITYPAVSGLKAQYYNGSSWSDVGSIGVAKTHQVTITGNTTVYARYVDSTGQAGANKTITIGNIDKSNPNGATVTNIQSNIVEKSNFNVTISLSDVGASGINAGASKYILSTTAGAFGVSSSTWNSATIVGATSKSITLNASSTSMKYLHVLSVDNAGNKTETVYTFNILSSGPSVETVASGLNFDKIIPLNSTTLVGLKGYNGTGNEPAGNHYNSYVNATTINISGSQVTFGPTTTICSGTNGIGYNDTIIAIRVNDNQFIITGASKYISPGNSGSWGTNRVVASLINVNGTSFQNVSTVLLFSNDAETIVFSSQGIAGRGGNEFYITFENNRSTSNTQYTVTVSGNTLTYAGSDQSGGYYQGDPENKSNIALAGKVGLYDSSNLGYGTNIYIKNNYGDDSVYTRNNPSSSIETKLFSGVDANQITHMGSTRMVLSSGTNISIVEKVSSTWSLVKTLTILETVQDLIPLTYNTAFAWGANTLYKINY